MKIAVASSDGKVINAHFGRTPQFLIFDLSDQGMQFVEQRRNAPGCTQLNAPPGSMDETVTLIRDCSLVLVAQIGPAMVRRLEEVNITAIKKPKMIDEALREIEHEWKMLE